jgi:hypothetical protein
MPDMTKAASAAFVGMDAAWAASGVDRMTGDAIRGSALARLETRIRLADHEDLATAANDLAVAVTGLRRLQGGQDLHGNLGDNAVECGRERVGRRRAP